MPFKNRICASDLQEQLLKSVMNHLPFCGRHPYNRGRLVRLADLPASPAVIGKAFLSHPSHPVFPNFTLPKPYDTIVRLRFACAYRADGLRRGSRGADQAWLSRRKAAGHPPGVASAVVAGR
jgi:hypothetical protein